MRWAYFCWHLAARYKNTNASIKPNTNKRSKQLTIRKNQRKIYHRNIGKYCILYILIINMTLLSVFFIRVLFISFYARFCNHRFHSLLYSEYTFFFVFICVYDFASVWMRKNAWNCRRKKLQYKTMNSSWIVYSNFNILSSNLLYFHSSVVLA